jgi:hypothetical protein
MRTIDKERWSEPDYMVRRYMQSLKATMAYIEKHRETITKEELLDHILIVEHLVERIINLKPETSF